MITTAQVISLISAFKEPFIKLISDLKDEVGFYYDTGIVTFVENTRSKYVKTKTFLYRLENIDFYDIYFPVSLRKNNNAIINIEKISDLFSDSNCISIIGNAGSGKSILMKHVFLSSVEQLYKIPLVIELRNLNEFEGSFFDYINNLLSGKKIAPNKKILERVLESGEFLFLLDGYDEIFSTNKNKLTGEVIDFIDTYSNNNFLITSRPGANVEALPRFNSLFVNPLSSKDVRQFINIQLKNCGDKKLAANIISVVDNPENKDYNSYLSSPLLLSMFIMTFNSYPELPKSKNKFYWNVFDTLCSKHDSFTKQGGYQHERKTGLQNEDFENILKWFSYISLFKGKYSFDSQYVTQLLKKIKEKLNLKCSLEDLIEDLTVAISIIMIDGLEYKFPHKSLQEYFAAQLIKEQPEKIKENIYSEKLGMLSNHTFGGNQNIWNLFIEIDPIPFKKYFLIKYLKSFIKKLDLTDDKTICESFHRYFALRPVFSKSKDKGNFVCNRIQWSVSTEMHVLEYENLLNLSRFGLSNRFENIDKEIEKLIIANIMPVISEKKTISVTIDYGRVWDEHLHEFASKTGVKDETLSVVSNALKRISDLQIEIDFYEKSNIELLEL